jgi:hypothetical protein
MAMSRAVVGGELLVGGRAVAAVAAAAAVAAKVEVCQCSLCGGVAASAYMSPGRWLLSRVCRAHWGSVGAEAHSSSEAATGERHMAGAVAAAAAAAEEEEEEGGHSACRYCREVATAAGEKMVSTKA